MFFRRISPPTALAIALVCLSGCSKGGTFATVSGVVTHNGNPVEGAKVFFHSTLEVEGKRQQSYSSLTDSTGKYIIATNGKDPGIPPALYKVTVVKYEGKGMAPPGEGVDQGQLDAIVSDTGGAGKGGPVNLLPKEYATLATSKLSATLEPGQNQNVNFNLKGK